MNGMCNTIKFHLLITDLIPPVISQASAFCEAEMILDPSIRRDSDIVDTSSMDGEFPTSLSQRLNKISIFSLILYTG